MRKWSRRCRWVFAHLCWNDGAPDPRVLQIGFTSLVAGAVALRAASQTAPSLLGWPVAGLAMSVVGAVAVLLAPAERLPGLARLVAVLNIAALGMLAAGSDPGTASPLLILPALWLGQELGLRGAAVAVTSAVAFLTIPGVLSHGTDAVTLERLLVLPIVAGVGALSITAGLTAARAAQARAEAREAQLERALAVIERNQRSANAIFEAVDIGLALLDEDGTPSLMNQRLAEFSQLAYPGGDLDAAQVYDESGTVRLEVEAVPTARARRGEEFDDIRVWVGDDERTRRAMSISARRVEDADGELLGAAVSYTDITEFMRALEVKDEFIALVSHELRTPLTSIVGYVSIILDEEDVDPLTRRQLEVVERNALRLQRLVGDLIDEVQHSRSPRALREQQADLAQIVRDSVAAARPQAESAGVRLVSEAPTPIEVTGDPQRLAQVVDNLVSNAIKYTGSGGHAHVHATIEDEVAVIRVSDTGIGIDPADQRQLFTRFFRTKQATVSAIQGVGLGLSISKSIVEGHGGLIEVESEVGRGSEFRVRLPLGSSRLAS